MIDHGLSLKLNPFIEMKTIIGKLTGVLLFILTIGFVSAQSLAQLDSERVGLPNGWSLTPVGKSLPLGDLPLNMAVSKSNKWLAVTNNGQSTQSIQLIDVASQQIISSIVVAKCWYGLKFSADEKYLYASGGNDNMILRFTTANKTLVLKDSIVLGKPWPNKMSPTGIEINDAKQTMYVTTKDNNSLYVIDLTTKNIAWQLKLEAEAYACVLSADKQKLFISCWGCDKVLVVDLASQKIENSIAVGDNPNELLLSKNGQYLFVANANDNSVSIIDTKQQKVVETLNAGLFPNSPSGSTSNGLALSSNQKTLYIANADNNCLAVFDVSKIGSSKSKGFIPTGWYPTNVKVVGKKVFVANGKGFSSKANPYGPSPILSRNSVTYQQGDTTKPIGVQYIAGLFMGTMSLFNEPTEQELAVYSQAVYQNTPYTKQKELMANGEAGNPIPMKVGEKSPIKYVFYIIKENRTYDQVLGDMKEGKGDPGLVLFGEHITPNQHALARQFVLLDNFYCDGEVSADGHNWSMGAYATDFLEKTWVSSYGGRGGGFDSEGNRAVANNKGGFIWDMCKRNNVTYRTYGEFADNSKPNIAVLKGHTSPTFTGWDLSVRDTVRFSQWRREFDSLLAINQVPSFNSMRFPNDHTSGLSKNKPSPFAYVADNDLAVGKFVDYLSKSKVWNESAVFIVEDDAQNGADHIDAHRTTAYVAGGFVKRNFVDHSMYSTSSMLRTIELILGLPPMTQYDAAAMPMWRSFQPNVDTAGFTALPANIDLNLKNTAINKWQKMSDGFNFAKEDAAPDLEFSEVVWHAIKGDNVPFPGPKRAAFLAPRKGKDKDDD